MELTDLREMTFNQKCRECQKLADAQELDLVVMMNILTGEFEYKIYRGSILKSLTNDIDYCLLTLRKGSTKHV